MKFQVPRMTGLRSWIHCCCSESALETLAHGFEGEGGRNTLRFLDLRVGRPKILISWSEGWSVRGGTPGS